MQNLAQETATVHIGHVYAYGEVVKRVGEYVTVRASASSPVTFTGRAVNVG